MSAPCLHTACGCVLPHWCFRGFAPSQRTRNRKKQLLGGFAAVISVFVLSMVVVGACLNGLAGTIITIRNDTLLFVVVLGEMDLNRLEVQRFLTDVSATRGTAAFKEADEASSFRRPGWL